MKRGRMMRKLTPMQIETLTTLYYGEVYVRRGHIRPATGPSVFIRDIIDHDGTRLTGRCGSRFKRRLIRWCNGADYEAVVLTDAGIKEMEKIDA